MYSEEIIGDTAASIQTRIPAEFDSDAILKKYPTIYEESMNTVLIQVRILSIFEF